MNLNKLDEQSRTSPTLEAKMEVLGDILATISIQLNSYIF